MRIAQVSGLGLVWGTYAPDVLDADEQAIGGGEAAMLQTSFGLAERGHEVTVYYPGKAATYRSVDFLPLARTPEIAMEDYEAVVSWSDTDLIMGIPDRMIRVFSQQLNDIPAEPEFWGAIDVLISPSNSHASFLMNWAPRNVEVVIGVLGAGTTPSLYTHRTPSAKRAPIVSYWSSPDRGLHHLLLCWEGIRDAVPDAELRIFYHAQQFAEGLRLQHRLYDVFRQKQEVGLSIPYGETAWRATLLDELFSEHLPGVRLMGRLPRKQLAVHQLRTKVMAYPLDPLTYTEGFGVSVLEAHAAGCRVVARPDDAIEEISGQAISWVRAPVCDKAFRLRFTEAVVEALTAKEWPYHEAAKEVVARYTWPRAAESMEQAILRAASNRQGVPHEQPAV